MTQDPFPRGTKKLKGTDGFRIRVGDYRILYRVDPASHVITVGAIKHRKEAYR